jgi:hypothetical protein
MGTWGHMAAGESNGNLPLRTCLERSVPEPYRSPNWALVPAKPTQRLNTNNNNYYYYAFACENAQMVILLTHYCEM